MREVLRCGWNDRFIFVPDVCLEATAYFLAESAREWRILLDGRWIARPL